MFNLPKDKITFEIVEAFCREWREGVRVEYKSQIHKDIPKSLSSFANTQGGILIIGINTDKTHNKVIFPITGIPITDGIEERIVQSAITGIYPPVMPEVTIIDVPETENIIIVVRVEESHQAPHAIQNSTKVYIRFESITQPYTQPQLAELNDIEYLFKRRQDPDTIIEPIINEIEARTQQFCDTTIRNMKVIIRPVLPYRPVISPSEIFELFQNWVGVKRVVGGVSCLLEQNSEQNLELNEYGLLYYRNALQLDEISPIYVHDFIEGIDGALNPAKKFYQACDYLGNIEVITHLQNVNRQELAKYFGTGRNIHLRYEPICYNDTVKAKTSQRYLPRDFIEPVHQKNIFEDLTMQLLWAFNIPTDNDNIRQRVAKLIEPKIDTNK